MATIFTIGHGNRSADGLVALLRQAGIARLVDVRAYPASRRHPQFSREPLAAALAAAQIDYEWQGKALGGFRDGGYVQHMETAQFQSAAAALSACERVCLMCAETDPAQCHRSHIADWLAAKGHEVVHLLSAGQTRPHQPHPQQRLI